MPKVTVLMSVYNGERYLREAVESVLNQAFAGFEFIIIDDGSTDATSEILDGFGDPRIVRFMNERNIGLAGSLNKGLAMARGEYIARMDADDINLPERLAKQVVFLDEHREVGVVGCAIQVIDADGSPIRVQRYPTTHGPLLWALCFYTPLAHPTVVFRKAVVERVGGYDCALLINEDRDLWQRLSSVTRFANLPEVLFSYRMHPGSACHIYSDPVGCNSAKSGQRMMSGILGYNVSLEVCRSLGLGRFQTAVDALQAVSVIRSLYDTFMGKTSLSTSEKRVIRSDATQRLVSLAWRWMHKAKMRREFLALALRMNPLLVAKVIVGRTVHKCWRVIARPSQ